MTCMPSFVMAYRSSRNWLSHKEKITRDSAISGSNVWSPLDVVHGYLVSLSDLQGQSKKASRSACCKSSSWNSYSSVSSNLSRSDTKNWESSWNIKFLSIMKFFLLVNIPCLAHGLLHGVFTYQNLQRKFWGKACTHTLMLLRPCCHQDPIDKSSEWK
jgi:hypothetical protein